MVLIVILRKNTAYLVESQKSKVKRLKSVCFYGFLYDFKTLDFMTLRLYKL